MIAVGAVGFQVAHVAAFADLTFLATTEMNEKTHSRSLTSESARVLAWA